MLEPLRLLTLSAVDLKGRVVVSSKYRLLALRHVVCADASKFDPALLDKAGATRAMNEWAAIVNAAQAACDMAAGILSSDGTSLRPCSFPIRPPQAM